LTIVCSFDFNSDGLITPEDVRLLLSFIPFKSSSWRARERGQSDSSSMSSENSLSSASEEKCEGMFGENQGAFLNPTGRL
jgi:hypothetical protein